MALPVLMKGNWYEGTASVSCRAPSPHVYRLLADVRSHLEWGGERNPNSQWLIGLDAPEGPAETGTEFRSEGHTSQGRWHDRSTVVRAVPHELFEFRTEGVLAADPPTKGEWLHRYEISSRPQGCSIRYTCRWQLTVLRIPDAHPLSQAVFSQLVLPAIWERGLLSLVRLAEDQERALPSVPEQALV